MRVYLKIENHAVTDAKYQIRGCPAAIACASAMTELAIGKDLDDAMMISDDDIVEILDGLQVSTGASLVRAAITVAHIGQPAAVSLFVNKKIL